MRAGHMQLYLTDGVPDQPDGLWARQVQLYGLCTGGCATDRAGRADHYFPDAHHLPILSDRTEI